MKIKAEVDRDLSPLSNKENQVYLLLSEGLSRPEIAKKLFRSKSTIDTHFNHILQKLDAFNSSNAIAIGIVRGILSFKKMVIYGVICSSVSGVVSPVSAYASDGDSEPPQQRHVRGRVGNRVSRVFGRCRSNRKEGLDFDEE